MGDHTLECPREGGCTRVRTVISAVVSGVSDIAQVADLAVLRHQIDRAAALAHHVGAALGEPDRDCCLQRRAGRGDRYTVTFTSPVQHATLDAA